MEEYENKIALLSTELERVNCLKFTQLESIRNLEKSVSQLDTQLKVRDDIIEEKNQEICRLRR
jgi:hypothetical protein